MRRDGSITILETMDEAFDVFYRHAIVYDTAPSLVDRDMQLADAFLQRYWDALARCVCKRSWFDFDTGEWYGSQAYLGIETNTARPADDPYRIAAQFIHNQGLDNFAIRRVTGDDHRGICFIRRTGDQIDYSRRKCFVFKDTVDPILYLSALGTYNFREERKVAAAIKKELDDFMNMG